MLVTCRMTRAGACCCVKESKGRCEKERVVEMNASLLSF